MLAVVFKRRRRDDSDLARFDSCLHFRPRQFAVAVFWLRHAAIFSRRAGRTLTRPSLLSVLGTDEERPDARHRRVRFVLVWQTAEVIHERFASERLAWRALVRVETRAWPGTAEAVGDVEAVIARIRARTRRAGVVAEDVLDANA